MTHPYLKGIYNRSHWMKMMHQLWIILIWKVYTTHIVKHSNVLHVVLILILKVYTTEGLEISIEELLLLILIWKVYTTNARLLKMGVTLWLILIWKVYTTIRGITIRCFCCDSSLFERYIQHNSTDLYKSTVVTHPYLKGIYNKR